LIGSKKAMGAQQRNYCRWFMSSYFNLILLGREMAHCCVEAMKRPTVSDRPDVSDMSDGASTLQRFNDSTIQRL
jgi:hypothetical protein